MKCIPLLTCVLVLAAVILLQSCDKSELPTASEETISASEQILYNTSSGQCVAPPSGLVSWWPGDGNATDIVNGNNGTLQGGASFATGQVGPAFSLDGINDFVDFGTGVGNFGTADFTVDLWVNFNSLAGEQVLIEKYIETLSASRTGWGITKLSDNRLLFFGPTSNSIVIPPVSLPGGLAINTWYHIAARRTGNTFRLYFNGAEVASALPSTTLSLNSAASLKLGHRGSPGDTPGSADPRGFFLNGLIDEVEIFNRALSASEIQAIYNAGSAGKCKFIEVEIDIKPGSDPNSINPKSKGVIPVAILTTDEFDATAVDPLTVEFGPNGATEAHGKGHIEDVDNDGDRDLVLHFRTRDTGIAKGDTEACLTGQTLAGEDIVGCDIIKAVGK